MILALCYYVKCIIKLFHQKYPISLDRLADSVDIWVNIRFIFLEEWLNNLFIDYCSSKSLWVEEIDVERKLKEIVKGDEWESESNEAVENSEKTVYYPIS